MTAIITKPGTTEKLRILSADAQYDLACACNQNGEQARRAGADGKWIYPVSLPNGGKSVLFKTLLSNSCAMDCRYCPLRDEMDVRRCTLTTDEVVRAFLGYLHAGKVHGMFLSSSVIGTANATMQRLIDIAESLRLKHRFRGYIHLKIIPGASNEAIEKAVSLASAVSLNIETPGAEHFSKLSARKDYMHDIIAPMKLISRLTQKGERYDKVKQTTQFVVGAAGENDADILRYSQRLYDGLGMQQVFFSAYQRGLGNATLPGESKLDSNALRIREHRLYQSDYLLRKYAFTASELPLEKDGYLSLTTDPKLSWALLHDNEFPVDINSASKESLLRVPGFGPLTVNRILRRRKQAALRSLLDVPAPAAALERAAGFVCFGSARPVLFT
ncbi:MAG: radical SAM protein [Phycisphaerae bacterium]